MEIVINNQCNRYVISEINRWVLYPSGTQEMSAPRPSSPPPASY